MTLGPSGDGDRALVVFATNLQAGLWRTGYTSKGKGNVLILTQLFAGCAPPVPPAGPLVLHLPIACSLGDDCWLVKRPDVDPGPEFHDHTGAEQSSPDHSGTDLAVANVGAAAATWVVSPVAGTVVGVRDGEDDGVLLARGIEALNERNCGNGVTIDAGEGWEVQLCHLRQGTVVAHLGDRVEVGSRFGRVGWSGEADFPHVHVTVRHDTRDVDPFTGLYRDDSKPAAPGPLWAEPLPTPSESGGLAWVGFDAGPPPADGTWPIDGGRGVIPEWATSVSLTALIWRPEAGDIVRFAIVRPDGTTTTSEKIQPRDRPRQTWTVTKTWPADARPTGLWTGHVEWQRDQRRRALTTSAVLK